MFYKKLIFSHHDLQPGFPQGKQGHKVLVQGINTGVAWVKTILSHPSYKVGSIFSNCPYWLFLCRNVGTM